jgi:hypothetical protein
MKKLSAAGLLSLNVALCGCATIFEGTSQTISVVTNPTGATCVFEREGKAIGTVASTPGPLVVRKSKDDITVKCNKLGYQEAAYLNHSGATATIAANIAVDVVLTAGLSSIIDSADGADNKYDSVVNLSMVPDTAAPGVEPVTAAVSAPR